MKQFKSVKLEAVNNPAGSYAARLPRKHSRRKRMLAFLYAA